MFLSVVLLNYTRGIKEMANYKLRITEKDLYLLIKRLRTHVSADMLRDVLTIVYDGERFDHDTKIREWLSKGWLKMSETETYDYKVL